MAETFGESDDAHRWALSGHRITQVCVDLRSCRLQTWSLQASIEVRIAVTFEIRAADGSARAIDPERTEQAAPLLGLIGQDVLHLEVTRSGTLEIRLRDGSMLVVDSNPRREAFDVIGGGALEGMQYRARRDGVPLWE